MEAALRRVYSIMRLCKKMPAAVISASLALAAAPAAHAQPPSSTPPEEQGFEVPGGDIFGFTSPTDVGEKGDRGLALELSNRAGKRDGRYWSPTLKTQFSYTLTDNFAIALSPFVTAHRIREVPDLDNRTSTRFDGFSGEIAYRFIERSQTNPFAATFSMEPRIARVDALTGERVRSYGNEFKLFLDTVLVPETLYAAVNVNYALGTQQGFADDAWADSSGTSVSAALTYQITDRIFAGVEGRWLTAFSGAFLDDQTGWGLFAGPTLLVKVTESAALNLVWTPQVTGRASGIDGHLDLDNFERHQFRAKFATSF
jgi:hypothetical protein